MALTAAERAKRYRDGHKSVTEQRHVTEAVTEPVTPDDPYWVLPALPEDTLIHANADIGWADVLVLPRDIIDEVYHVMTVMWSGQQGGCIAELLLRLVRAAGYAKRRAAA